MSKLSKFKSVLPMPAAAELLSELIGEKVSVDDLFSLYESGWMRLFRPCSAEIVKLAPMFEKETHEDHLRDGRYFMQADRVAGVCLGILLPCDEGHVESRRAYMLRDAEGGCYAIRDNQTDEYLSPDDDDDPNDIKVMAVTADIYEIAEKANANTMPVAPTMEATINNHCILTDKPIYNFSPNEEPKPTAPTKDTDQIKLPPSLRITVAALLEAATSERKRHTQASLIDSILDKNRGIRGLSESSLQKHFSDSNAELAKLRKIDQS